MQKQFEFQLMNFKMQKVLLSSQKKRGKLSKKVLLANQCNIFPNTKNFKLFAFILLFKGSHYSELTHPVVIKGGNQDVWLCKSQLK